MSNSDLFTYVILAIGLLLVAVLFFAKSHIKFVEKNWSRVIALVLGAFMFISMNVARELFFPTTDLLDYLIRSLFLSVVMGVEIWIVFGIIEWLWKRRKKKVE